MTTLSEANVNKTALGWQAAHAPHVAPNTPRAQWDNCVRVVLERSLQDAVLLKLGARRVLARLYVSRRKLRWSVWIS